MVLTVCISVWTLYAWSCIPFASGITHHQTSTTSVGRNSLTTSHDYITLPIPSTVAGPVSRLPTNEETAITAVDDLDADDDENINNLKEIEELIQHPVPDSEVEQEREALQSSGDLPPGEPLKPKEDESETEAKYSKGVSETAEIFGSATNTLEDDVVEDGGGETGQLRNQINNSMDVIGELPSVDAESIIKGSS